MRDLAKIKIQKIIIPYYDFKRQSLLRFSKFYKDYYNVYKAGKEIIALNYQPKDYNFVDKPLKEDFKGVTFLIYNGNFYLIGGYQNYKFTDFNELVDNWHQTYNLNDSLNKEADSIFKFFNLNFNKDFFKKTIGLSDISLLRILQTFSIKFKDREPYVINIASDNFLCRKCKVIFYKDKLIDYELLEPDFYVHYKTHHLI